MQKVIVMVLAAFTTTGCAHLAHPGPYGRARHGSIVPAPLPPPLPVGRWDNVMRLPRGSIVDVLSMNAEAFVGPVAGVDGAAVRVVVHGVEEQIPRAEVMRVDLVDLPGSEVGAVAKRAGLGAVLGVGAAALIGGVIGGPAWPPPGALLRGGAAIGGVAGGEAALAARRGRVIYLAEHQGSTRHAPVRPGPAEREAHAPIALSYPASEWSAIANLSPGRIVRVVQTNGRSHQGSLLAADDASLRLDVEGAELRVTRASIVRVEVLEIPAPAARRSDSPLPTLALAVAGGHTAVAGPAGFLAAAGAAPLVRLGAPTLPFGGAQAQILRAGAVSSHREPSSGRVPVAGVGSASRVTQMSVCHAPAVRIRR